MTWEPTWNDATTPAMNLDTLSQRARTTLAGARDYAKARGHAKVTTEHVLMALVVDAAGAVPLLLQELGADPALVERRLHAELPSAGALTQAEPPVDPLLRRVLESAQREAQRQGSASVKTEHLLIAIADGPPSGAATVLASLGVTREALRALLKRLHGANPGASAATPSDAAAGRPGPASTAPRGATGQAGGTPPVPTRASDPRGSTVPAPARGAAAASGPAPGSLLAQFGIDLTERAAQGRLDPVIGRDAEIRRLTQVLSRRSKNNPVLVGEPGVGKTAIVEAFAQRLADGDVPAGLKGRRLVSLEMASLVAGTSLRGQLEERLTSIVDEVVGSNGQIILFIDEVHSLVGGGEGRTNPASMLKPALARGEIRLLGTTTPDEYRKYIEDDAALERRFQTISVDEPNFDECLAILRGIKARYEIHHGVRIADAALAEAIRLSTRYVTGRSLPDKAIDLVDEACSWLRLAIDSRPAPIDEAERRIANLELERQALLAESGSEAVAARRAIETEVARIRESTGALIARWEAEKAGLDALTALKQEREAAEKLVVDAERAGDIGRVAELKYGVISRINAKIDEQSVALASLTEDGSTLLREVVGPQDIAEVVGSWTGIPVSKMLEGERERLLHMENSLRQRVCGQDDAIASIAAAVRRSRAGLKDPGRPIGNFFFVGPTGVGKTELAKALAEFLFDTEKAIVRIDMSEYMEQSKVNTLIGSPRGYVDSDKGGVLTEPVRQRPYSVVLFDEAEKAHPEVFNILLQILDDGRLTDSQGREVDFSNTIIIMTSNVGARRILDLAGTASPAELEEAVHDILRDSFKPEFLNRLDDIVVFRALDQATLRLIVDIMLRKLGKLLAEQGMTLDVRDDARDYLAEVGFEPEYGARPLKRAILSQIQDPLSLAILEGRFVEGDTIVVDREAQSGLTFVKRAPAD